MFSFLNTKSIENSQNSMKFPVINYNFERFFYKCIIKNTELGFPLCIPSYDFMSNPTKQKYKNLDKVKKKRYNYNNKNKYLII